MSHETRLLCLSSYYLGFPRDKIQPDECGLILSGVSFALCIVSEFESIEDGEGFSMGVSKEFHYGTWGWILAIVLVRQKSLSVSYKYPFLVT